MAPVLLLLQAGPAWAPHVAQLQVSHAKVAPGQEVTVFGPRGYGATNPVEIWLDSPTGPVLGTFRPDQNRFAQWGPGTVTIPADIAPGQHVLWATQDLPDSDSHIRGVPARAVVEVIGPAGSPLVSGPTGAPVEQGRPTALETSDDEASLGTILLVGLGVGGVVLLAAAGVALAVGRQSASSAPRAVKGGTK